MKNKRKKLTSAMSFIVLLGIVSLFSDMTHEGASSIRGAYLSILGASAATIGFVSGLGELVGYSLRFVFGRLTDKTKKYWAMTIAGYVIDCFAVPALALVPKDGWIWACILLMIERTGKAIKKPAKNTLLSFAASQEGAGKSFAIQEALDQIGAFLGPLMLYGIMLLGQGDDASVYSVCFAALAVPALLTVGILIFAKHKFPHPDRFEPDKTEIVAFKMNSSFRFYLGAISLFAFGFIDFSLITMHVAGLNLFATEQLPLLYAAAMLVDAAAALLFGRLYDQYGSKILMLSTAISSLFALFVFGFPTQLSVMIGVLLWGIGMGAQESILKAAVSVMIPKGSRAAGYGIFECSFGIFWFLGSWLMGVLYDGYLPAMIAVSIFAQLLSIPLYLLSGKKAKPDQGKGA